MSIIVRKFPACITWIVSSIFILYFFMKIPGNGYSAEEQACYIVVLLYSTMMLGILGVIIGRPDFYVFEPIVILWFLFFCVYGLQPMIDLINKSTDIVGIETYTGGIKCTIIVAVSFAFLTFFYYRQKTKITDYRSFMKTKVHYRKFRNGNTIALLNGILWAISAFLFFIYLYKARGLSLQYILSAGNSGEYNSVQVSSTPIGFLSNCACPMIASFIYYLRYGKSRILKAVMGISTLILFVLNGYRFIIVMYALALLVYHYTTKHKKPSPVFLALFFIMLLIMAAVLAATRNSLRHGGGWDFSSFGIESILSPFESNFILYKPLWRMVEYYPSEYSYTFGYQMFVYTAILLIPRAIWPGKPLPPTRETLMNLFHNSSVAGTQAFSSIGEYYQEFGIIGCLFFMSLTGYICGRINKLYLKKNVNDNDLILYSMLFPIVFSLTNGGYTPNNFYMVLFALMPVIATKVLIRDDTVE